MHQDASDDGRSVTPVAMCVCDQRHNFAACKTPFVDRGTTSETATGSTGSDSRLVTPRCSAGSHLVFVSLCATGALHERLHHAHELVQGSLVSSTYEQSNGKGKKAKTAKTAKIISWSIRADVVHKLDRGQLEPQAPASSPEAFWRPTRATPLHSDPSLK